MNVRLIALAATVTAAAVGVYMVKRNKKETKVDQVIDPIRRQSLTTDFDLDVTYWEAKLDIEIQVNQTLIANQAIEGTVRGLNAFKATAARAKQVILEGGRATFTTTFSIDDNCETRGITLIDKDGKMVDEASVYYNVKATR